MKYGDLYFEDFTVGRRFETESYTLNQQEIISFGKSYAPLPYHIDEEAAKDTFFGRLVAPGYQTVALTFGMLMKSGVFEACSMGSPGCDGVRWLKPVEPGDTLRVEAKIVEANPPRKKGGRNLIKVKLETYNQKDEMVQVMYSMHYVKPRPA